MTASDDQTAAMVSGCGRSSGVRHATVERIASSMATSMIADRELQDDQRRRAADGEQAREHQVEFDHS